jgi:hypothetical protein
MIGRFFLASAFSAMAVSFTGCQGPTGNDQTYSAPGGAIAESPDVTEGQGFSMAPTADQSLGQFPSQDRVYRNVIPASDLIGTNGWGQFARKKEVESLDIVNESVSPPISSVRIPSGYTNEFASLATDDVSGTAGMSMAGTVDATNTGVQSTDSVVRLIPGVPTRQEYLDWVAKTGLTYKEATPSDAPARNAGRVGTPAAQTQKPTETTVQEEGVQAETIEVEAGQSDTGAADSSDQPEDVATNQNRTHEVQKDENLWIIAKKYYGKGAEWQKILDANKDVISSADELTPGMNLVIP